MTTVPRPEGHITVRSAAGFTVGGSGSAAARQMPPDYVPPGAPSLWLDTGSGDGSVPRGGSARVFPARIGGAAFDVAAGNGVGRTNAQNVVTVGSAADGLVGEWGPLSASWTACLIVRLERPVTSVGNYVGTGTAVTLLSCPSLGIAVDLPAGGSVPSGATRAYGGPLDGAAPGDPWDLVCVGVWRTVWIRNDVGSGVRTVSLGNYDVAASAASTGAVPANTVLRVGPGASTLSVAELVVWDGLPLSDADRANAQAVQRLKWAVPAVLPDVSVAVATPPAPPGLATITVVSLPPACGAAPIAWWDVAAAGSLWADLAGSATPAVANGRVRCWRSRTGTGAITFAGAAQAVWVGDAASSVNGLPVLSVAAGSAGAFAANPLATATAYTIVAIWRVTGTGHPLCLGGTSAFGNAAWTENLGKQGVSMGAPPAGTASAGAVVCAVWERDDGGILRVRLGTVDDLHGGHVWTAAAAVTNDWTWQTAVATVAGPLDVAELLVWPRTLSAGERSALVGYLTARWGTAILAAPAGGTSPTAHNLPGMVVRAYRVSLEWSSSQYQCLREMAAYAGGVRRTPVSGGVNPAYIAPLVDWHNLDDDNPSTSVVCAHTNSPGSMWLVYGLGVSLDEIRLTSREPPYDGNIVAGYPTAGATCKVTVRDNSTSELLPAAGRCC